MNAVGITEQGNVESVVDQEQGISLKSFTPEDQGLFIKASVIRFLVPELDYPGATGQDLIQPLEIAAAVGQFFTGDRIYGNLIESNMFILSERDLVFICFMELTCLLVKLAKTKGYLLY
jgi:hypothetical protein